MFFFVRLLKSTLSILAYINLGFNQLPISDSELSEVVDWDQLSSMANNKDDSSNRSQIRQFIDWEAEEEDPVDVPPCKRNRKRAGFSEGSDMDETVASKLLNV